MGRPSVSLAQRDLASWPTYIGMGVTNGSFETTSAGSKSPTTNGGLIAPNGANLMLENGYGMRAHFNNQEVTSVFAVEVNLKRLKVRALLQLRTAIHHPQSSAIKYTTMK